MGQSPKVLWMTGVHDRPARRDGVGERVLHKAFGSRELLATVREVLDGGREPATVAS
jgi:hypothetical protein